MDWLINVDWRKLFVPETPILEIVVRGSLVYLGLFALMRLVLKREAGALGPSDLLVVVLIAAAAQNALADDYRSVPDGLLLVAVILFWAQAVNWLGFRSPRMERVFKPPGLALVRDGRMLRKNMAKELITEGELWAQLRLQGVDDLSQVEAAYVEPNGRISVICANGESSGDKNQRQQAN